MLDEVVVPVAGALVPALFPVGHMFLYNYIWGKHSRVVNRSACHCDCWDTFYKGSYEVEISGYKHVYFNATSNTLKIWLSTVLFILVLYECICRIVMLWKTHSLRLSIFVLFCSSLYSHYYAWWALFNYWNDEFYSQWYHQMLFTVTETICTSVVVNLLDAKNAVTPWKLVIIAAVCFAHCATSMSDQFALNVLGFKGKFHQMLRDIGFMYSDVLHICVALWELKILAKKSGVPPTYLLTTRMVITGVLILISIRTVSGFL